MYIKGLLVLIVLVVVLYVLIRYVTSGNTPHTDIASAKVQQTIKANKLGQSDAGSQVNFAHMIWFYIADWNERYGYIKPLIVRMPSTLSKTDTIAGGFNGKDFCPAAFFGEKNNTLKIYQKITNTEGGANTSTINIGGDKYAKCVVTNIPIQKWCCLLMSFYGRTLDVYLDGKLIRTCVMDGPPDVDKSADVQITPGLAGADGKSAVPAFDGYTANYHYFGQPVNPQQAYDLYKKGFGKSWLQSLLNTQVSVIISKNGTVQKEYTF
tara:strand:+ start:2119 stop:2916 length:798 start_codon:yes stop_codon:yes gene_type:complete